MCYISFSLSPTSETGAVGATIASSSALFIGIITVAASLFSAVKSQTRRLF